MRTATIANLPRRFRQAYRKDTAEQAGRIEIDVLGKPIGRQDAFAAAFGGLSHIRFEPDGRVEVEPVPCRAETIAELERRAILVYTGQTRDANPILERQAEITGDCLEALRSLRDLAGAMREALDGAGDGDVSCWRGP